MRSSNPPFAKASAADTQALAFIASSLVAATAVAFVAMILTIWPARAGQDGPSAPVRLAALPSGSPAIPAAAPALSRPAVEAPVEPAAAVSPATRTAALGTLPLPAQPCTDALAAAEAEMNQTLARVEALEEADIGAQCTAFRVHMTSLQRAAATVNRCVAGRERLDRAGFIRQSLSEWRGVVANGCR